MRSNVLWFAPPPHHEILKPEYGYRVAAPHINKPGLRNSKLGENGGDPRPFSCKHLQATNS